MIDRPPVRAVGGLRPLWSGQVSAQLVGDHDRGQTGVGSVAVNGFEDTSLHREAVLDAKITFSAAGIERQLPRCREAPSQITLS